VPQITLLVTIFFFSLSTSSYLPFVTKDIGSVISSHGVGIIDLFPSLSIDPIFYVSESPFNLLSISRLTRFLDYVISFIKDSACLQD